MGFPYFFMFTLLTVVGCAFEIQSILLSNLSEWERWLYASAKVLFAVGILFASVQYRVYKEMKTHSYVVLAALYLILGSSYTGWNILVGRYTVALNSGQHQTADLKEAEGLQKAADQKHDAADKQNDASGRFASSTKRGSAWAQKDAADKASKNADQSAELTSKSAKLLREAGITEQQVVAMISPYDPSKTMLLNAAMFALVMQILELLTAGGAADYIAAKWLKRAPPLPAPGHAGSSSTVVDIESKRKRQGGRMLFDESERHAPATPITAAPATPDLPNENEAREAETTSAKPAKPLSVNRARTQRAKRVNFLLTDAQIESVKTHIANGGEVGQDYIKRTFKVGNTQADAILAKLQTLNIVERRGRLWRAKRGVVR